MRFVESYYLNKFVLITICFHRFFELKYFLLTGKIFVTLFVGWPKGLIMLLINIVVML